MLTQRWFKTGSARAGTLRWLWLLTLLGLALVPRAQALDIQFLPALSSGPQSGTARGMALSGAVAPGDTAKLLALLRRQPADAWSALSRIELNISGGDQTEALLLADTLAPLYPHTVANASCAGACAIVWLAGAWRLAPGGQIGLEKPAPTRPPRARASDAPPPFDVQAAGLRTYYLKQGVPMQLYERWASGAGTAAYWLSEQDINATGTWPPHYFEKLHARCPRLEASEESYHALRRCALRLVISQKAFAFDKLLADVNDPWWKESRTLFLNAPR